MTLRQTRIHPDALQEASAAVDWYRARSAMAAERLIKELDSLLERIAAFPEQFPRADYGARQAFLRRFPFTVVLRESGSVIDVVAVAHAKRRPGYWRARI